MANVNFYLKNKNDKESAIYAIFHFNHYELDNEGNKKFIPFKYPARETIKIKFWDFKNKQAKETSSFPEYSEFNTRLRKLATNIKNIYRRLENDGITPTPELLKTELDKLYNPQTAKKEVDLFSFIQNYIDTVNIVYNANKPVPASKSLKTQYKNFLGVLRRFADEKYKGKLDFKDIDLNFYSDYFNYMRIDLKYATNTIGKQIGLLKKFLNEATEQGINSNLEYKKRKFAKVSVEVDTIYLSKEEVIKLYEYNLSYNKGFERVRDIFIIACNLGLRYSDYHKINTDNIISMDGKTYFKIHTQKTKTAVIIPINSMVKEILNKYDNILPKILTNQRMNEYLKDIGQLAKINEVVSITKTKGTNDVTINKPKYELITTHTARRTGATNMYLDGIPVQSIMKITGHKTEKAFMSYLRFSDKDNARVLSENKFFQLESNLKLG